MLDQQWAYWIVALVAAGLLYGQIRHNPESFSWHNVNKSMFFLGILALLLILFLSFAIMALRISV